MNMESSSQDMQDIINMLLDENESVIAEAVIKAVSSGETRHEFIIQQVRNLRREQDSSPYPGCSFWHEIVNNNPLNAANEIINSNAYIAKTCTSSSDMSSSSWNPVSCLATFTTPIVSVATLGNDRAGSSFTTNSWPRSNQPKTSLAGARSSTMTTETFERSLSGNQTNISFANYGVRSIATLPPLVPSKLQWCTLKDLATSTSMPAPSGLVSSLKTTSSLNSFRTDPGVMNAVNMVTNNNRQNSGKERLGKTEREDAGCLESMTRQKISGRVDRLHQEQRVVERHDRLPHLAQCRTMTEFPACIDLDKTKPYAEKRRNGPCETQQVQITPKKIKLDKPGNSSTQSVCTPINSDAKTGYMRAPPCQVCKKFCLADKPVRCNKYHIICERCLNVEMYSVITTDKMNLSCPVTLCNGEITLDAVSSLQTSVPIEILKDNIHKKQLAASLKTIQQLEGLVSCPRCQCAAQLDENIEIYSCVNSGCQAKCCRYCKAPWLEGEEHVHVGCSLFKFSGSECFKDISVLPDNWTMYAKPGNTCQENGYVSVRVSRKCAEGIKVCVFYGKSSNCDVVKLTRIHNRSLWEKYVLKRKHIKEEIGEEELREKFLFHGTGKENIDKICREGFDFRKLSRHGTAFGKGNYFSTTAHYSETFSRHSHSMFLVRVLCGRSTQGHPDNTHPPYETSGRMFDSCVDNPSDPSMYIVYSIEQCYPAYIITFMQTKSS